MAAKPNKKAAAAMIALDRIFHPLIFWFVGRGAFKIDIEYVFETIQHRYYYMDAVICIDQSNRTVDVDPRWALNFV
ncbi:MAG: hypothetical protein ACRBM6_26715 [Geminicoccales bacterium]